MVINLERAYDGPAPDGGFRVLVDRLWPRGISRERARLDLWLKDVAPSPGLRSWWNHDPQRLAEFARRYRAELESDAATIGAVDTLREVLERHPMVTLVYGARDPVVNHAAVLRDYLVAS
ncbi:DUF488 domain-containing protein [Luethyella okanaganae]|uniref:DUF488 domain-containing protein n=1 Tax=Luethyella okanaganae TaxID=69372 RepID=A0ABW1VI16_9MICO